MDLQRVGSIKRTREEYHTSSSRPSKRNSISPRISTLFTPPHTPEKKPSRSSLKQRSRLITTFKNAFTTSPSKIFHSPVSDDDLLASSPEAEFTFPLREPETTPLSLYSGYASASEHRSPCINDKVCRALTFDDVNAQLSNLTIEPATASHIIFHIPEILYKIISYVDEYTSVPCEESPTRRRPLSFQHALLIYKDEQRASQVWQESLHSTMDEEGNPVTNFQNNVNSLYSCLLVNKLWYRITSDVASTKLFFTDGSKWDNFVEKTKNRGLIRTKSNTKLFVMHKLSKARQKDIDIVSPMVSGSLEWIEMYICPKVLPTPSMLSGSYLKKLVLPGSKAVDDEFLKLVSKNCPRLEHLDLRACGLVSDEGITHLASRCNNLISLNLGRHTHTSRITDVSLHALSIYTRLETLGVAGCAITDRGLWELALRCSDTITRLSLNNCVNITDNSLPQILESGYFPNLTVLEIRHVLALMNVGPLVEFKRKHEYNGQSVLIEGCEVLEYRMRNEEWKQDMRNSARILNEVQQWCNEENDGDAPTLRLRKNKRTISI